MIYLAADQQGYEAVKLTIEYLEFHNMEYVNLGVKTTSEDMRLEDFIPTLAKKVLENKDNIGILSCGTGVGVEVGANKFSGIRACLASTSQIAEWSRVYDDCNVLCLIGWDSDQKKINAILKAWFDSEYDGNEDRLKMFETFNTWR